MAYALSNSMVFYGDRHVPMNFETGTGFSLTVITRPDDEAVRDRIIKQITHSLGNVLSFEEVKRRAKFMVSKPVVVEGREMIPEQFVCRGDGFSVVWNRIVDK